MSSIGDIERWDAQCKVRGDILGFQTGFEQLTKKIDGWQKSKFYVLTADTNIGKTDTFINVTRLLLKHNSSARVAFITLDDDISTILMRLVAQIANITKNEAQSPRNRIAENKYYDEWKIKDMLERRTNAVNLIKSYMANDRFTIYNYDECKTVLDIYKRTVDYNCVIVDGFHNLTPATKTFSKNEDRKSVV